MNRPIAHLFAVVTVMFGLLIVFTSRWTVFQASALQHNSLNRLDFYAGLKIKRGRILADNGEVLARSVPAGGGTWKRTYPQGSLFAQAVGYDNEQMGSSAGLEQYHSQWLSGRPQTTLSSVFGPLGGGQAAGDDLYTTLDPRAQSLARSLMAGRSGAVVAIVPQTGAVKVLYSNPSYNDNNPAAPGGTQFVRAVQGEYPPGSTFKIVTTTAALNSGKFTPNSMIVGNSPLMVSGVPLQNDANASYGPVTLTKALTYSINTVYAQVGQKVGKQTMAEYMKRFGFYARPPLDLPADEMTVSGERYNGRLLSPTSNLVDVGRMSIGQDKLTVTPLQMAMVVSAVADNGTLMKPQLVTRAVNVDGQVVHRFTPQVYSHVMRPQIATELRQMMTDVVEEGTGTAANLQGLNAAGKTGTATVITGTNINDAWFIGLAPVAHPKVAVAVELDSIPNGYGGTYAAPIAAQVMKLLIAEGQ
ncbi:MAG TPA: penicillin-binding protein 2 [Solirubrobacteraceae bacterium]|nr:penicillin-binding protein 2 [Solirubrobacteraceae bacterium]